MLTNWVHTIVISNREIMHIARVNAGEGNHRECIRDRSGSKSYGKIVKDTRGVQKSRNGDNVERLLGGELKDIHTRIST